MDEEQNRRLRSGFRELLIKVDKEGHASRHEIMERADALLKDVQRPQEAVLDAQLFTKIAGLCREKAEAGEIINKFGADEFADRLNIWMSAKSDKEKQISPFDALGNEGQSYFRRPPYLSYLLGSFEAGPISSSKSSPKKSRRSLKSNEVLVATRLSTSKNCKLGTNKGGPSVEQLVEIAYNCLVKGCRNNGKQPINYFSFVVDPQSFSATIRNMFHASFLVKEKRAALRFDEDDVPHIKPLSSKRNSSENQEEERGEQVIMTLQKQQWIQLVKVLGLKSAMIQRSREDLSDEET